jgi:hypothetical protein
MWFIALLPDSFMVFIVHTIFLIGFVGSIFTKFVSNIPFLSQYSNIIKPVALVTLIIGLYLEGGLANELRWRQKVKDLEQQVKLSEEKAKTISKETVIEYKDRVKVVKDVQIVIQERIKEVEKLIDTQCVIAPQAIEILNDAALNKKPGVSK